MTIPGVTTGLIPRLLLPPLLAIIHGPGVGVVPGRGGGPMGGGPGCPDDTCEGCMPGGGGLGPPGPAVGRVEEGLKSSSMSSTLARRDFELLSLRSSSFILFCIMMVFRVIFSPGLAIRRNQGSHWRNTVRTWVMMSRKK